MTLQETDAAYYLRRAREETYRALNAARPDVASAHRGLSIQYAKRARSAFPQLDVAAGASFPPLPDPPRQQGG